MSNIIDIFKNNINKELAEERTPLYVSHGKISPHQSEPELEEFGTRITRIRNSLEKINKLVKELKEMDQK